jgi:hypothetical protein
MTTVTDAALPAIRRWSRRRVGDRFYLRSQA